MGQHIRFGAEDLVSTLSMGADSRALFGCYLSCMHGEFNNKNYFLKSILWVAMNCGEGGCV